MFQQLAATKAKPEGMARQRVLFATSFTYWINYGSGPFEGHPIFYHDALTKAFF